MKIYSLEEFLNTKPEVLDYDMHVPARLINDAVNKIYRLESYLCNGMVNSIDRTDEIADCDRLTRELVAIQVAEEMFKPPFTVIWTDLEGKEHFNHCPDYPTALEHAMKYANSSTVLNVAVQFNR